MENLQNVLSLAERGDTHSIAASIARYLAPYAVRVRVMLAEDCLWVRLAASQLPEQMPNPAAVLGSSVPGRTEWETCGSTQDSFNCASDAVTVPEMSAQPVSSYYFYTVPSSAKLSSQFQQKTRAWHTQAVLYAIWQHTSLDTQQATKLLP